ANICRSTGDVLFSSTPDDLTEPTHHTVRPGSAWIAEFAAHGFQLDVEFDAGCIAPHAMRFKAGPACVPLDSLLAQRGRLLRQVASLRLDNEQKDGTIVALAARRDRVQSDLAAVQRGAEALRRELMSRRALQHASESRILTLEGKLDILEPGAAEKDELIAGLNYHF